MQRKSTGIAAFDIRTLKGKAFFTSIDQVLHPWKQRPSCPSRSYADLMYVEQESLRP
jgi:hypothetical protein